MRKFTEFRDIFSSLRSIVFLPPDTYLCNLEVAVHVWSVVTLTMEQFMNYHAHWCPRAHPLTFKLDETSARTWSLLNVIHLQDVPVLQLAAAQYTFFPHEEVWGSFTQESSMVKLQFEWDHWEKERSYRPSHRTHLLLLYALPPGGLHFFNFMRCDPLMSREVGSACPRAYSSPL